MASPESKAPEEPLPQQQEKGTLVDIAKPRHMKLGKAAKGRESSLDLWRSGALTYGNNSKQKKKKAPGAAAASPLMSGSRPGLSRGSPWILPTR